MKADLYAYGCIGFQDFWLKKQKVKNRRIAAQIGDSALEKGLDIVAITSHDLNLAQKTIHDRFYSMTRVPENSRDMVDEGWRTEILPDAENQVMVMEKEGKILYVLNSQVVIMNQDEKRMEHLVIGSNNIPQQKTLVETLDYAKDNGLISI